MRMIQTARKRTWASTQRMASNEPEPIDQSVLVKCSCATEVSHGLYLNRRTADVFFTFEGSTERVPAHKVILSMGSSVFDKMFFGPSAVNGDILIVGYSPYAFKNFLQFFYYDVTALDPSITIEVLRLALNYKLPIKCTEICLRSYLDHFNYKNVDKIFLAYRCALIFQVIKSQAICEHQIAIHCEKVFKTAAFLTCPYRAISRILDLDTLLCDESLVLEACLDWARRKCKQNGKDEMDVRNLHEYLTNHSNDTNLLYKIRYGSIPYDKFSMHLNYIDKLFPDVKEREDVTLLIKGSSSLKTGKFSTKQRKGMWNDENAIECLFPKGDFRSLCLARKRSYHTLKTNRSILLDGFYIVPLISRASNVAIIFVDVSIKEQQHNAAPHNAVSKLIYKKHQKVPVRIEKFFIQLKPKPILMYPDCEYHIGFHLRLDCDIHSYRVDSTDCDSGDSDDMDNYAYSISFYDQVESNQEIKVNENLTIQCHSNDSNGHLLIKGLKFIQL